MAGNPLQRLRATIALLVKHKFNGAAALKETIAGHKRYKELQKSLETFIANDQPGKKSVYEMSTDEFYDYVTDPSTNTIAPQEFYQFLLDYILTAYLTGRMNDVDLRSFFALDNPLKVNRYVERMVRNVQQQGTLLDELLQYDAKPEQTDTLYSLVLPEYAYDRSSKKLTINTFDDLKAIVKDSTDELQKQKKRLAYERMQTQEKQRQEDYRKAVLANTPEIAELIGEDNFQPAAQGTAYESKVLKKELAEQKKGTVIRAAAQTPEHQVSEGDKALSPSELVKLKEQLLEKLRQDVQGTQESSGGMTIRI